MTEIVSCPSCRGCGYYEVGFMRHNCRTCDGKRTIKIELTEEKVQKIKKARKLKEEKHDEGKGHDANATTIA